MTATGARLVIDAATLDAIVRVLRDHGYTVVGPTVRDGAIVLDELRGAADLPAGWGDEQEAGAYRLRPRDDAAWFGFAVGAHSWKRYLFPPRTVLVRATRHEGGVDVEAPAPDPPRYAFIGVRACDLVAIDVQDRVFLAGPAVDPEYAARRTGAFVIAVNCGEPAATCFCTSMGTGPRASGRFDLALTELLDGEHRFVVEVGSGAGAEVLAEVQHRSATADDEAAAEQVVARATARMGRTLDVGGLRELLLRNLEHPRWDDVANRCLGCANCTMVCPTCFCSAVEDSTDLIGAVSERTRVWDSCFTLEHSRLHGGSVRPSTAGRYRQWMVHKLATWHDQFDTSGCVGCGRCITWCPVGIDITEEAAAIRATDRVPTETGAL